MNKEAMKAANAALKAKMDAAGYTEQEQVLGTLVAEFKAALAMVEAVPHPMAFVSVMAISGTVSKMLAYMTRQLSDGDKDCSTAMAHRVVAVCDMVMADCVHRARTELGEQSDEPPVLDGGQIVHLESFRRPTDAKDIN